MKTIVGKKGAGLLSAAFDFVEDHIVCASDFRQHVWVVGGIVTIVGTVAAIRSANLMLSVFSIAALCLCEVLSNWHVEGKRLREVDKRLSLKTRLSFFGVALGLVGVGAVNFWLSLVFQAWIRSK